MRNDITVSIDLSKEVFHVVSLNHKGRVLSRAKETRQTLTRSLSRLERGTRVVMEACGSAHYWSRTAASLGLVPQQIPAQHVKPYVGVQKNDYRDAEAIGEASMRARMKYVPVKPRQYQEVEGLHRIRERLVRNRTALTNEVRGLLLEMGVSIRLGRAALRRYFAERLFEEEKLSRRYKEVMETLISELDFLEERIATLERRIADFSSEDERVQRLMTIPGIGILTASALAVVSGNPSSFKNGRQFAAFLGLVPRQFSTGGKTVLGGITKRGDAYVRRLLISGAHAVIRQALAKEHRTDPRSLWIRKLHAAKGSNLTAVAVANKNARTAWKLLTSDEQFVLQPTAKASPIQ